MKCYLIPYAGASAYCYIDWKPLLEEHFDTYFVELPGRGSLFQEKCIEDMDTMSEYVADFISNTLKEGEEYILFGHSMGALIVYEAYYKLRKKKVALPKHIYLSCKGAPHIQNPYGDSDQYNDKEFLEIVSQYGGLPDLFYDPDMQKTFMPILRADFRILSHYVYKEKDELIQCDLSILLARKDRSCKKQDLMEWRKYAGKGFDIYQFEGDHFYLKDAFPSIIELITKICR